MIEHVRTIILGWDNIRCEDNGAYWLVAGSWQGKSHAGTRADPIGLALDLVRIAKAEPVVVAAPEPVVAPVIVAPNPVVDPDPVPAQEPEPVTPDPDFAPIDQYKAHWDYITSGTLGDAVQAPVFEEPITVEEPAPDPRDAEIAALKQRIAELEEVAPVPDLSDEPPADMLAEALPDEDHMALKIRLIGELSDLRNMLVGHMPMTQRETERLAALENPKLQVWLLG